MSIWKNGKLIAGGSQALPLLSFMWADHQFNHPSWLRANTFSWQYGSIYQAAYTHLANDFVQEVSAIVIYNTEEQTTETATRAPSYDRKHNGVQYYGWMYGGGFGFLVLTDTLNPTTSSTVYQIQFRPSIWNITSVIDNAQSETIGGITVKFYLAADGHKICLPDQETNVAAIYNATGVAWYYILDTANQRFKLPRSKHNKYADSLGVVGNGNTLGFIDSANDTSATRVIAGSNYHATMNTYTPTIGGGASSGGDWEHGAYGITTDPETSGIIARQEQDTDQYKYLYFYVGQFTQTALENTAGLNAELFNGKADITSILPMVAPDYANAVTIQAGTTEQSYTCPSYGFVVVDLAGFNYGYCYLKINGVTMFNKTTNGSGSLMGATGQYMVSPGDVCKFKSGYSNGETFAALGKFMFIPCKGVN